MKRLLNLIGGELVPAEGGRYLANPEPATGQVYSEVADSDAADIERAVEAAARAFPAWSRASAQDRARALRRMAEGIAARSDELARAESMDNGKPLSVARAVDIPRAEANFAFFADAATQFASESHARPGELHVTLRAPLGVVGCISPWNLPLYLLTWKIAPALAAGCTVVAKPSEVTPMTAYLLSEISREAGLPPGVLNVVHGTGARAGSALVAHPLAKAISFTGSTKTGSEIARVAGSQFKKLSLEMGGKNPFIVFADADFDLALDTAVRAAFSNQGQICLCGSRIYVERPIYQRFREGLIERVRALRVGDPLEPGTDQGAVVSAEHQRKILSAIATAREEGGKILCGGGPARVSGRCEGGWFVEPTLIEGLSDSSRTNQEEIFGPVATLAPFGGDGSGADGGRSAETQATLHANATRYGLAASLFTRDLSRAYRMAGAIDAGIVWVNGWMVRDLRTPFGGMRESGVGREGGWDALRFFTDSKNVCVSFETAHTAETGAARSGPSHLRGAGKS